MFHEYGLVHGASVYMSKQANIRDDFILHGVGQASGLWPESKHSLVAFISDPDR